MDIWGLIFPGKCPLCGQLSHGICPACRRLVRPVTEPRCKHCGKPLDTPEREYCLDCLKKDSVLKQGTAVWLYDEHTKKLMADFKYGGCAEDGKYYGEQMAVWCGSRIASWRTECIIPVPLHWRRHWFRGYNQAECLALALGGYLQIPVWNILKRVRHTAPQKGLDDRGRKENLRQVFAVDAKSRSVIGNCRSVLLIDDIYTTGATLESCGQVLKEQGVRDIYFACLCIGKDY